MKKLQNWKGNSRMASIQISSQEILIFGGFLSDINLTFKYNLEKNNMQPQNDDLDNTFDFYQRTAINYQGKVACITHFEKHLLVYCPKENNWKKEINTF